MVKYILRLIRSNNIFFHYHLIRKRRIKEQAKEIGEFCRDK
jgi:hypothetical protein